MPKKETVSNYVVYGLGLAIIVVSLVAVLFAFSINSKINMSTSSGNSNSNRAGLLTVSNLDTSDDGYGAVDFSGIVHNEENAYAYNSQLHVEGVYQNGTKALDTYIVIGNQGVMTGNEYYTFDTGVLSYNYQANSATPLWTVTATCTTSP